MAYSRVISGVGDVGELLAEGGYRSEEKSGEDLSTGADSRRAEKRAERSEKVRRRKRHPFAYALKDAGWALLLAIYFLVSFATGAWHITWVAFLFGAALSGIFEGLIAPKLDEKETVPVELSEKTRRTVGAIKGALSLCLLAVYFIISFATGAWHITWVIFFLGWALENLVSALVILFGMGKNSTAAMKVCSGVSVGLYVLAFAGLIAVALLGLNGCSGRFSLDFGSRFFYNEDGFVAGDRAEAAKVDEVALHWPLGSLTVKPSEDGEVRLYETGAEEDGALKMRSKIADGKLTVYPAASGERCKTRKDLVVELPAESSALTKCRVDTASAEVFLQGFSAQELEIDSASGAIRVDTVKVGKLEIDNASGGITLASVEAETIGIDSSSGTITLSGTTAKKLDVDNASGGIDAEGAFAVIDIDTASGRVNIVTSAAPDRISFDAASGDFSLTSPMPAAFRAKHDGASGKMTVVTPDGEKFVGKQYGSSGAEYDFDTASGNITLTFTE